MASNYARKYNVTNFLYVNGQFLIPGGFLSYQKHFFCYTDKEEVLSVLKPFTAVPPFVQCRGTGLWKLYFLLQNS